jgi:class 3 adenylate cyclase
MLTCPRCGQENACAAPLVPEQPAKREERKVVTILFCDLVGSTARADRLDPEDVRALLSHYHARVRAELERVGGTVEKFIGDAVVAVFGAPVAHEDDPERAVRAALAIRDWAIEEEGPELRIAVNTGEALVTLGARPDHGEGVVAGDVVNTAARLLAAAPTNAILVGETTYRATRDRIKYREAASVEAKGKAEPIRVWEALEACSPAEAKGHVQAPLIGRERELRLLIELLERVRDERSPQLVTLIGAPGIGKSRLVYELLEHVEGHNDLVTWRQGRSLPYGEGRSFWALAEIVKAHLGVLETDNGADVREAVHTAVCELVGDDRRVELHLGELLGIGTGETLYADRDDAFAAWRRFFEAVAEQAPLVLVFDDLQWADEGLLDFVDHLVDWASGVPMLVVATARPELFGRRLGWGGGKLNASTLALSPLTEVDCARLIAALLERTLLTAETQSALLDRIGGNPLYAEQYALLYREREGAAELPLPETAGVAPARPGALPCRRASRGRPRAASPASRSRASPRSRARGRPP